MQSNKKHDSKSDKKLEKLQSAIDRNSKKIECIIVLIILMLLFVGGLNLLILLKKI